MNKTNRIFRIIDVLNQHPGISAKDLAQKLAVTERSVYRYLQEIEMMGFKMVRTKNMLEQPIKQMLPPVTFTANEVLALTAACQPLLNQDGLPLKESLQNAMQKVKGAMGSMDDKRTYYHMQSHFTFLSQALRDYSQWKNFIQNIADAIRYNKQLIMTYDSYSGNEVSDRVIDPYDLFFRDGNLYLAAYCHKRQKVCIFRIDRIQKLKMQKNTFSRDPLFKLDTYLGPSWRIWRGTEEVTVKFIIYPPASRLFKESQYHESQQINELDDGSIICTFTTYNTPEIKSWLLSWGKQLVVLEPPELVEEIKTDIENCLTYYQLK